MKIHFHLRRKSIFMREENLFSYGRKSIFIRRKIHFHTEENLESYGAMSFFANFADV